MPFVWILEYSAAAERDFELIFEHLFASYRSLGEPADEAFNRAVQRLLRLRAEIDRLVQTPQIGTRRPDIHPSIRFVRRDNAAIWFVPMEQRQTIVVAAIFYGAQDHIRRMLLRLLAE